MKTLNKQNESSPHSTTLYSHFNLKPDKAGRRLVRLMSVLNILDQASKVRPMLYGFKLKRLNLLRTMHYIIYSMILSYLLVTSQALAICSATQFFSDLSAQQNCTANQLSPILGSLPDALSAIQTACGVNSLSSCSDITTNRCLFYQRDLFYAKAQFACKYLTYVAQGGGSSTTESSMMNTNTNTGSETRTGTGTTISPAVIHY